MIANLVPLLPVRPTHAVLTELAVRPSPRSAPFPPGSETASQWRLAKPSSLVSSPSSEVQRLFDPSHGGSRQGLGPRWVRAATVEHGHQRAPTVAHGSEEPQVTGPSAHAAGITQKGESDCGPEGRGSSLLGHPTAARVTRHRDAAEVAVRIR
jgi:hypothetical protein